MICRTRLRLSSFLLTDPYCGYKNICFVNVVNVNVVNVLHLCPVLVLVLDTFRLTAVLPADVCVSESELGPPGWREPLDCVRASELCNQNSQCSSRYRIMRQCLSGGDKERSAMLASRECQGALEVLQESPLYDCRCKRGMKKELQCLQNFWSIHMGLTEGKGAAGSAAGSAEPGTPKIFCLVVKLLLLNTQQRYRSQEGQKGENIPNTTDVLRKNSPRTCT